MIDDACTFQIKGTILEELKVNCPYGQLLFFSTNLYRLSASFGGDYSLFEENCVALKASLMFLKSLCKTTLTEL